MRILLVEEEVRFAQYFRKGLLENGFAVDVVRFDSGGVNPTRHIGYELTVCDVGAVRLADIPWSCQQAPVLFLADRNEIPPATGQPAGNFLLKPFAFSDFLARLRALLRWGADRNQMTVRVGGIELDLVRHRVARDGRRLDLTPKEFLLLSPLRTAPGFPTPSHGMWKAIICLAN